jgi:hypothetical protein
MMAGLACGGLRCQRAPGICRGLPGLPGLLWIVVFAHVGNGPLARRSHLALPRAVHAAAVTHEVASRRRLATARAAALE